MPEHFGHEVLLDMKGCICHLAKWQIHPFISKEMNFDHVDGDLVTKRDSKTEMLSYTIVNIFEDKVNAILYDLVLHEGNLSNKIHETPHLFL